MINEIHIQNFKSIVTLDLDLGRFNVIIGPNDCGKSNILEAVSFASADAQNKLDYEYLVNRDVRITDSRFMGNAFMEEEEPETAPENKSSQEELIEISVRSGEKLISGQMVYDYTAKAWISMPKHRRMLHRLNNNEQLGEDEKFCQ